MPVYSQHMSQLCLRLKITACSENEAFAEARSFMPNQASKVLKAMNGTQMKPAFCSHISLLTPFLTQVSESPPQAPKTAKVITSGTTNCTTDTPRLPRPAFMPSAKPLLAFG